MDYIKKIYSIFCHANADPDDYGTDIIPMVCHNKQIDMSRTIMNAKSSCRYFSFDESKAQQIVHCILWRVERLSRLFSRHDPKARSTR